MTTPEGLDPVDSPCCIAQWITGYYERIILGSPFQRSLEEIWWGAQYLDFRAAIQSDRPPEPCRGCGLNWPLAAGRVQGLDALLRLWLVRSAPSVWSRPSLLAA